MASQNKRRVAPRLASFLIICSSIGGMSPVDAFAQFPVSCSSAPPVCFALGSQANPELENEINRGLEKAKDVLEKSKAKLEQKNGVNGKSSTTTLAPVPFFATASRVVSRTGVVKSVDQSTGLVTADGERMAEISEKEDWEFRPLQEVFESEIGENGDVYSVASKQLADRDVAASMWNLRKELHNEDYQRIFDKRNWFIGDDA